MRALGFVGLLGLGLALFGQADRLHAKLGMSARACEVTGGAVFLVGIVLIVATWGSSLIAWLRRLLTAPARISALETELANLRTEHARAIEGLGSRHAAEVEDVRREWREEADKTREEITELKAKLLGKLPERGKTLASVWVARGSTLPRPTFLHRDDPVYGQLGIHKRLFPVLCHPLIQRLNYVRQLSFAYLTFPSASHTRLSHLFGATKNAQEVLRKVLTRRLAYKLKPPEKDRKTHMRRLEPELVALDVTAEEMERMLLKAQLCALLHDAGHGPFGHALDKLVPYLGKQDETTEPPDTVYSVEYIRTHLRDEIIEAGFEPEEIAAILDKKRKHALEGWDVFIAALISSAVDIDRVDYLVRDAHMTGLQVGYLNSEALREQMWPLEVTNPKGGVDYNLVYSPAALSEMEDLAQAHHNMYIHCYEHRRKLAAERLLMRAVQYLFDNGLRKRDLMLLSDDQLFALMSEFLQSGSKEGKGFMALQYNLHFAQAADYRLSRWNAAEKKMECNPGLSLKVQDWHDGWTQGKPAALRSLYVDEPDSWEKQICRSAGLAEEDWWKVIVTVPGFDTKLSMESGAFVVTSDVSGVFLDDFYNASPILRNILTALVPERHVLRVMVAGAPGADELAKIKEAADGLFMAPPQAPHATPPAPSAT